MSDMKNVESKVTSLPQEKKEKGASMVEYALLLALIAVIAIVTVRIMGQAVSGRFSDVRNNL